MTLFAPQSAPRVFALPPGVDFSRALVAGLEARLTGQPPEAMARVEIWTNTRRAARGLTRLLAEGPPRLLPRMDYSGGIPVRARTLVAVPTLAVVALFAAGPTTIRKVAHIRHKESDRIGDLARELRKLGATVDERADGLTIHPGSLRGASIDTYNDHRMAMSFALAGMRVPGVTIRDPGCTAKTYPKFFEDLQRLTCPS